MRRRFAVAAVAAAAAAAAALAGGAGAVAPIYRGTLRPVVRQVPQCGQIRVHGRAMATFTIRNVGLRGNNLLVDIDVTHGARGRYDISLGVITHPPVSCGGAWIGLASLTVDSRGRGALSSGATYSGDFALGRHRFILVLDDARHRTRYASGIFTLTLHR